MTTRSQCDGNNSSRTGSTRKRTAPPSTSPKKQPTNGQLTHSRGYRFWLICCKVSLVVDFYCYCLLDSDGMAMLNKKLQQNSKCRRFHSTGWKNTNPMQADLFILFVVTLKCVAVHFPSKIIKCIQKFLMH